MDADRVPDSQAVVHLGVVGQERDPVLHHRVQDGAGDRHALLRPVLDTLPEPGELAHRTAVPVLQEDEAPLHRQGLERDRHHPLEDLRHLLGLDQELGEASEEAEHPIAVGPLVHLRGRCRRRRSLALETVGAGEVPQRTHDAGVRDPGEGPDPASPLRRLLHRQGEGADADAVPGADPGPADRLAVEAGAVGALEVAHHGTVPAELDDRVVAGDGRVGQANLVVRSTTETDPVADQRKGAFLAVDPPPELQHGANPPPLLPSPPRGSAPAEADR